MSELYEVMAWMIYAIAAAMMLGVIVAAILAGLALRVVAEFVLGLISNDEVEKAEES